MSKAKFKEKQKKLLEQRVRPTEGTEAVSAWDYDFNDSNEVLQSGEVELLENMTSIVPEDRPKTGEIFKEKRNKTRHKLDAPILSEQLSDYPGSLNARDAVPPMVLMMDDVPDDVQKSTLSDPVSLPTPELAVKKVSKDQSLVDLTREVKKHVHIISYGNTLYYYNNYYYTQLDIIKAYGLDKLVEVINYVLPTRVKDTFVAIQTASLDLKKKKAQQIVKFAAAAAAVTGAVPIPFSDAAILVPTQISMLVKITSSFGLSVEKAAMVGVISATIGTTGTTILGKSAVSNLLKFIPGAGTVIGGAISGATAAALTASLGEAYIAIMIKVTKGEMKISDLATSKGQMELKNEFERQMKVKRDENGEALEKQ